MPMPARMEILAEGGTGAGLLPAGWVGARLKTHEFVGFEQRNPDASRSLINPQGVG